MFARDFVVTINGRQETMDLDVRYWGRSLGEPTNYHLQNLLQCFAVHTNETCQMLSIFCNVNSYIVILT